jgi:hypothetical protein
MGLGIARIFGGVAGILLPFVAAGGARSGPLAEIGPIRNKL